VHREEIGTRMTRKERIRTDREFLGIKTVVQTFLFETIWNRARDFYKNAQTTRRKEEMASASADTKNAEFYPLIKSGGSNDEVNPAFKKRVNKNRVYFCRER